MTVTAAYTAARFFSALEFQIEKAFREDRRQDALSMCRLKGKLMASIFGFASCPFDNSYEVAA